MTYKQCIALMATKLYFNYADEGLAVTKARQIWAEVEYQILRDTPIHNPHSEE
jgi:hypothetical protein